MAVLRLFAAAREAAGTTSDEVEAGTVSEVLDEASRRYGDRFSAVLATSKVWVNGEPAAPGTPVGTSDVVAVLPPVSGGATQQPSSQKPRGSVRGNLALVPDMMIEEESAPELPPLAAVAFGLTVAGPAWLAGWLAVAAFVAGAQTCLVWRKRGERPIALAAGAMAAGLPVGASFDAGIMTAVVVGGALVTFVSRLRVPTLAPSRDIALTMAIGVPVGLAAASPVLVRHTGIAATLLLLAMVCIYDAGAYLVGTGAASPWEGPAAGVAALIPVTIFAEVVLLPPFAGAQPLFLGLLAAVLVPAGPVAASALLGDRSAHAPALRRLDSLLLVGPLWAWCAIIFLK